VSRHATRLEAAGLVRRQPDPSDGRAALLILTEKGEHVVAVMRSRLAERIALALADWPPGEAAAFARGLRRLAEEGLA
jgi:DNA-binding MarR family transcriptional regulator